MDIEIKTEREIKSVWSVPTLPDEATIGILALKTGEIPRLTLTFPKGMFSLPNSTDTFLHGCDSGGNPITLLFPMGAGAKMGAAISEQRFDAGYAIFGLT